MKIRIPVRKIENDITSVQAFIKSVVPRGAVKVALTALAEYFIGTEGRGLRHAPAYKHVSREAAGYGPMSPKMRRWFWANGGPDMIGNHRTGETQNAWFAKPTNNDYGVTLANDAPGVKWTMSDKYQARQPAAVGWRKVSAVVQSNIAGAMRHAKAKVGEFIRSRKK